MAVTVTTWVWNHSRSKHGARLVLLAIADAINEDAIPRGAWPSVAELVRKTGLKERAVRAAITELAELAELAVQYNAGRGGCNLYHLPLAPQKTPAKNAGVQKMQGAENAPLQDVQGSESAQVDDATPANFAPPAEPAPLQDSQPPPAESAPGTVSEPEDPVSSSRRKRAQRGTRLPADFKVTPEMVTWFRENISGIDGKRETDKFINHYTSKTGRDATRLDWPATWRNWMLNAVDWHPNGKPQPNGHTSLPADVSPRDEHRLRR